MGLVGDSRCCRRWGIFPKFQGPPPTVALGCSDLPGAFPALSYFILMAAPVRSTSPISQTRKLRLSQYSDLPKVTQASAKPGSESKPMGSMVPALLG